MIAIQHMLKNMFSHRTRLLLTIFALAWGTFSITTMLAVGEGLRITFGNVVKNAGKGALIVTGNQSNEPYQGQPAGIKVILNEQDLVRLQEILKGRAEITGEALWRMAVYREGKPQINNPIMAVKANYNTIHNISLIPGSRFIDAIDERDHKRVIVLGSNNAKKLFAPYENPLGNIVYAGGKPFLVIGVQKQTIQLLSTSHVPDDFMNWIPYSTYSEITNDKFFGSFIIAPYRLDDTLSLLRDVTLNIANSRQLNRLDTGLINAINLQKEKTKLNTFLLSIEFILGVIGTLTLIVAGVGIANVTYISVKHATREIGIHMVLGAKTYDILFYYAFEALLTTALGGLVGLIMAKGVITLIRLIPTNSEILQEIGNPRPVLSSTVMIIVILILGLIGLLSGIFPAKKAANINPAEALRYEA